MGLPAVAVAGRSLLGPGELMRAGLSAAYPLTDIEPDHRLCMTNAGVLLERVAAQLGHDWLPETDQTPSRPEAHTTTPKR
jgi:glycerate kinase